MTRRPRSLRLDLAGTLATEAALLVVGLLTGILAARWLLPEGRGAAAAILFWPQLLAGLGLFSLHEAASYRAGSGADPAAVVRTSFRLSVALAALTSGLGYFLIPPLLGDSRAALVPLARFYLLLFLPFNFVTLILLAGDQGRASFGRYNGMRLLVPFVYLVGLLSLRMADSVTVGRVVAANGAGTVFVALLCLFLHRKSLGGPPSGEESRALWKLSLRFHAANLLLFFASQADEWVVLTLWDNKTLGIYVVAATFASTGLAVVSGAFQKVLFPHLAGTADLIQQRRLLKRGLGVSAALLGALTLLTVWAAPILVPLLFGPSFREAVFTAQILAFACLLVGLKTIVIQSLRGLGENRPCAIAAGLGLAVLLLLAWPLGETWGLPGVAAALSLADGVALSYLAYHLQKRHRLFQKAGNP